MKSDQKRFYGVAILALFWISTLAVAQVATAPAVPKRVFINPFDQPGRWYKANLHTHCKTSDGDCDLPTRVKQYKDKGYSVLAITDHRKTNPVAGLSSKDFLLISGMEMHPDLDVPNPHGGISYHLVGLNLPQGFTMPEKMDARSLLKLVKKLGGETIYAHPYWSAHGINEQILPLMDDCIGVEVYNTSCLPNGNADSTVIWDQLLWRGCYVPAVAVDDSHTDADLFGGWTMIRAKELTLPAIMEALRTGCTYSSTGPVIEDFRIKDGKVVVTCSPVVEIDFMTSGPESRAFYAPKGTTFTTYSTEVPKKKGLYVRVQVTDAEGHKAWTNPLMIERKNE